MVWGDTGENWGGTYHLTTLSQGKLCQMIPNTITTPPGQTWKAAASPKALAATGWRGDTAAVEPARHQRAHNSHPKSQERCGVQHCRPAQRLEHP